MGHSTMYVALKVVVVAFSFDTLVLSSLTTWRRFRGDDSPDINGRENVISRK